MAARTTGEVVECVQLARASGERVRIRGGGTWLDAGQPVDASIELDLSAMSGIVAYEPGDLTLTALAGTTLAEIREATARRNQWLALDPVAAPGATIGAVLATASEGALAATIGRPRDIALGLEVVTGGGEVIAPGGRVVKNVAGFDLVRLNVGASGTLGVITECCVRLRGRAGDSGTLSFVANAEAGELAARIREIREAPVDPLALQVVSGGGSGAFMMARIAGSAATVAAQSGALTRLGWQAAPEHEWETLARAEPPGSIVFRLSVLPSRFQSLWARCIAVFAPGHLQGSPGRGTVRCVVEADFGIGQIGSLIDETGAHLAGERGPPALWSLVPILPGPLATIERRLRSAFDPDGILNRGLMGAAE
ncbi:MAG: FAD-binding oxidoreductase [Gemmatimonadota bacterium]